MKKTLLVFFATFALMSGQANAFYDDGSEGGGVWQGAAEAGSYVWVYVVDVVGLVVQALTPTPPPPPLSIPTIGIRG